MSTPQKIRNVALSVIGTIAAAACIGVWKFYHEWTVDEQTEEAQMFDSAEQKVETLLHVQDAMSTLELREHQIMDSLEQNAIIQKLDEIGKIVKHADSMAKLNAVQVFLIKDKIGKNQ